MDENNLIFLRDNYENQITYYYIEQNVAEYVKIMTSSIFDFNELIYILDSDVENELKLQLLEFTNLKISVENKEYSPELFEYIMDNNFDIDDIPYLFSSFEKFDDSIKNKVIGIAIENISMIINSPENVSEKLKDVLLQFPDDDLEKNKKCKLFAAIMPNIDKGKVKNILDMLELNEYKKIFEERKRPKIEISEENQLLLEAFKKKKYIVNYEEDLKKEGYYKITKHKPNKKFQ